MQNPTYVKEAFARIADRYVITNHILSCGMDVWWRLIVTKRIEKWKPKDLLDVASGTGELALSIQDALPACDIIATDFCAEMLDHAAARGIEKTVVADALHLPFHDDQFDVVTVAFGLRNMENYAAALKEMRRVLKQDGRLVILDFSLPKWPIKPFYRWYLHFVLPKLAGWLTHQQDAYEYLGQSIETFPAGEQMLQLLESCGYQESSVQPLSFGVVSIYEGKK